MTVGERTRNSGCANAAIAVSVVFAVLVLYSSYSSATQAQTSSATQVTISSATQAETLFRSNARVVLIDVLATDKDGNPIRGLKAEDFTLTDEGKAQRLNAVEEHEQEEATEQRSAFVPRQDTSTNWVQSPAKGAVNIIVFDVLNTPAAARAYARQQMLKILKNVPPGQQLALFTLGTRLRMVQDFTAKSDVLIAAAEKVSTGSSPLSPTEDLNAGANRGDREMSLIRMDLRVAYTLDAFRDLARATASLPGRKNVIWLTAGFPTIISGTFLTHGESTVLRDRDYNENMRSAAAALASSQIAIYPIDVNGLSPDAVDYNTRDTLQNVAEETGGRAYYDKNDIDFGIRVVLTKGSNYYTLAYSPRIKWDGSYRKVSVKLARKGVDLTYRRGYHAVGDTPLTVDQASRSMGDALGLDTMDSRLIVLAAQVKQPKRPGQPVKIECYIDPSTLVLDDNADGRKSGAIAIGAAAWDEKKHKAADVARSVFPVLRPEEMAKEKTSGIPWILEVPLGQGNYTLKLAVVDLRSGKVGSLTVPLKVEVAQQGAGAGK